MLREARVFERSSDARKEYHHSPIQHNPLHLKQIWLKWKTLRLPWRRQFLAGSDLSGNTFWEFKDAMNANRYRRIVKYAKAGHYSDVKVSGKCSVFKQCDWGPRWRC
jgi:hypothetical protein